MTRPPVGSARRALIVVTAAAAGLALGACGSGTGPRAARPTSASRPATTTTTAAPATTTTAAPATTTTAKPAAAPAPAGLGPGASGPEVTALQQQLVALHYDLPAVDGRFGAATTQAVLTLQKTNRMPRTGRATADVLAALRTAAAPAPLVPGGGATRVEVDVARQVLFFYQGDALYRIVAVSTGSGSRYCVQGRCATAVTPGGSFRVRGKVGGWQTAPLGRLYKPSYFNGGIAVHGALSVPAYPASHGCVRVPMTSADWLYAAMPKGTPVYVLNGPHVPAPFGDQTPTNLTPDRNQAPGDTAPEDTTSTTAAPPTTSTAPPATTSSTVPPSSTTSTVVPTTTTAPGSTTTAPGPTTSTGGSGGGPP